GLKMEGFFGTLMASGGIGAPLDGALTACGERGAPLAAAPMSALIGSASSDSGPAHLIRRVTSFIRARSFRDAEQMMDMSDQARVGASAPSSGIVASPQQTLEELLRWLARTQNVSGSW